DRRRHAGAPGPAGRRPGARARRPIKCFQAVRRQLDLSDVTFAGHDTLSFTALAGSPGPAAYTLDTGFFSHGDVRTLATARFQTVGLPARQAHAAHAALAGAAAHRHRPGGRRRIVPAGQLRPAAPDRRTVRTTAVRAQRRQPRPPAPAHP